MANSIILELQNGIRLTGKSFGYDIPISGELVFQTGLTGYPESITDPSYAGQILVMTYPLIGNYGWPKPNLDNYGLDTTLESNQVAIKAIVVQEYIEEPNHWNCDITLSEWLKQNNVVGISGIDTRQLTKIIRKSGCCQARIYSSSNKCSNIPDFIDIGTLDLVKTVSINEPIMYNISTSISSLDNTITKPVLFFDCGAKNSQLRALLDRNIPVYRVPFDYFINIIKKSVDDLKELLDKYCGIFISNGPGNPERCYPVIEFISKIFYAKLKIPIFGICLGHQIMGLAAKFTIKKMRYGNRGHNIPVIGYQFDKTQIQDMLITSQNHGYCLEFEKSDIPTDDWLEFYKNANDNSNEGIFHKTLPYMSVQFHPEARGGPNDANFLFDYFYNIIQTYETSLDINPIYNLRPIKHFRNEITSGKVLILGSGGLSIGQAGEFDYSGSQAIKAYKEANMETILVNPNIATIQTSKGLADKIYYLPITPHFVEQIIAKEKPEFITLSFGGQTSLNCGIQLYDSGILDRYNVKVLGTSVESVKISEDRQRFKDALLTINIETPSSITVLEGNVDNAIEFANQVEYPVLVRAGFALGGQGSGFAHNDNELYNLVEKAFQISSSVIVDKSLSGWRELEYEIIRDATGAKIAICNMENLDPLGVHTGESIVVAPSQTLTDTEHQTLRTACFKIVDMLDIVGECNVQFAVCPSHQHSNTTKFKFYVIEMNARLSRSSALASKATGYPIAYIASHLSLNKNLIDLKNKMTLTSAFFEPSLDYVVVKIPRWDLSKFPQVSKLLGSHMKSVGEVMAIGRTFKEALQKGIRMVGDYPDGLVPQYKNKRILQPHSQRIIDVFTELYENSSDSSTNEILNSARDKIVRETGIDKWFINQISQLSLAYYEMQTHQQEFLTKDNILRMKQYGFCDKQIAIALQTTESIIHEFRTRHKIFPFVKQIDTVAGEFPCYTNYLYLSYNAAENDIISSNGTIVLGSGVYRIGSSVEFDWCSVSCVRELMKNGHTTIMVNNNPETVSTDYDEANRLYFEELTPEVVIDIYRFETASGIVLSMGGQSSNNIAMDLFRVNLNILGTHPEMIDMAENRYKFSRMLDTIGIAQPEWRELSSVDDAKSFCQDVGYPTLVRPSYVLSGAAMNVVHSEDDLERYLIDAKAVSSQYPVVISKFIENAKEIEVDAVAKDGNIVVLTISEHIENAGVHSGDATLILPAQDLTETTISQIKYIAGKISSQLNINGPFNIQLIAKDDKLKVIECNLRVSRSFPFASKTLDVNMIQIATNIIIGNKIEVGSEFKFDRIGVKVPQFSFHRLEGADMSLGVEMSSTGEVACFGKNKYIAYMKALMATGFNMPKATNSRVLLSIGSQMHKEEFTQSVQHMLSIGYSIYGTSNTADYYSSLPGMKGNNVIKVSEEEICNMIKNHTFDLVVNISDPHKRHSKYNTTFGYKIRRLCLDYKVSLVVDIKCAKLLVNAIYYEYRGGMEMSECDVLGAKKDDSGIHNIHNSVIVASDAIKSLNCIQLSSNQTAEIIRTEVVFTDKYILSARQFTRNLMRQLFLRAMEIYNIFNRPSGNTEFQKEKQHIQQLLDGKVIGLVFETPSTRTRCSFESAIKRMGGETIHVDLSSNNTSKSKGETFYDTLKTMQVYCEGLIVRANNKCNLMDMVGNLEKFVINAGDMNEHITQGLADCLTIREERGSINGSKIALVGDLSNSRVINSLVRLLCQYNVELYFVAPKILQINQELEIYLGECNGIDWSKADSIEEVIGKVDVIYMTRLQKERITFETQEDEKNMSKEWSKYQLTPALMAEAKKDMIVMHPMPRNDEIPMALDYDNRSAYFRQMKYAMYLRMALLEMIC